jgi:ribonuclease Z
MECVVLGNGGMMPMPARLTTSVLVRREGRMLMFDAGEGIQIALKKGGLGILGLDAVVVSHLHADHVLGLPGVMMFRAQNESPGPLTLIGPPGLGQFIEATIGALGCYINYNYEIIEWTDSVGEEAWRWGDVGLVWKRLDHSCLCLGYRLEETPRPGRFRVERAEALSIPKGPLYKKLQDGETVIMENGEVVRPEQVLGPPRRGRVVSFATDTRPCSGLDAVLRNADLAFVEGMFAVEHGQEALQKKHMTAEEAARAAKAAKVLHTVLVHISPRYSVRDEEILRDEAARVHEAVEIGKALSVYPVRLPD